MAPARSVRGRSIGRSRPIIPQTAAVFRSESRASLPRAAHYLARGAGYTLYLSPQEALLSLAATPQPLRLSLPGANPNAMLSGLDPLPGKSNYIHGNDPAKWITGVAQYQRVKYSQVYPGVDLIYYGDHEHGGRLEYDFVVAPGADPKQIQMSFGRTNLGQIDANSGDLLLQVGRTQVRNLRPVVYQMVDGRRHEVRGSFRKSARGVRFEVGPYDRSHELVIDPVILFGQVFGTTGASEGLAVALDAAGNTYITGTTTDTAYPTVNAYQGALVAQKDVFISKVNATGTALVYSTFLGGSGSEVGNGIAVDTAGNAYIAGYTQSSDFPTHAPLQASLNGTINAFAAKLDPTGSTLVYSTYLGGNSIDTANAIAIDASGAAYLTGYTLSSNFPLASPLQSTLKGTADAFVTKINPGGTALVYSTYLGGSDVDQARAIAVDSAGNAYIAGSTASSDYPTVGPVQAANAGGGDIFISKLNAAGSALVYSTFYGGTGQDDALALALDANHNIYVSGVTSSLSTFPTYNPMPLQPGNQGGVLLKLNAAGSAVVYATTLDTNGRGVAVDSYGNAYVTGRGVDLGGSAVSMVLRVNALGASRSTTPSNSGRR